MMRAEFEGFCTLQFITTNARWAGGNGCESLEEWLEKAVKELPHGSDLLAQVLIAIMEEASVVG